MSHRRILRTYARTFFFCRFFSPTRKFIISQTNKIRASALHNYEEMLSGEKYEIELNHAKKLGVSPSSKTKEKDDSPINKKIESIKATLKAARSKDNKKTLNVATTHSAVISSSTTKTRSVAPYHKFNLYPTRHAPKSNVLTADSKHFDPERRMSL